jgi:hypothetical protein
MSELDSAETHNTRPAQFTVEAPIIISQDHARQGPADHQVLYVLGFGVAGAILANMLVFIYFVLLHALG